MPTGIEELISAAVVEVEAILVEILDIGSELTKQAKVDFIKDAQGAHGVRRAPPAQRGRD